jgi:hypothetical protein
MRPNFSRIRRSRLRAWSSAAVLIAATSTAWAGEIAIDCPEGGGQPKLSLRFDANALSVTDPSGAAKLPGSLELGPSGMFTVSGSGPMQAVMPDPAKFDECLAANLKQQNAAATDTDAVAYGANSCRLTLTPSGTMQNVQANFTVTALEPGKAMVFIQREFTVPSKVTGKPVQLDEFMPSNCDVLKGP